MVSGWEVPQPNHQGTKFTVWMKRGSQATIPTTPLNRWAIEATMLRTPGDLPFMFHESMKSPLLTT